VIRLLARFGWRKEAGHRALDRRRTLGAREERLQRDGARDRPALGRRRLLNVRRVDDRAPTRRREGEGQIQRSRDEHLRVTDDVSRREPTVPVHDDVDRLRPAQRLHVTCVLRMAGIGSGR